MFEIVRLALHHWQRELLGQRGKRCEGPGERPSAEVRMSGNCAAGDHICRPVRSLSRDGTAAMAPSGRSLSRRVGVAVSDSTSRGSVR